jgi:large exoprotein involved in heme utilization and adhesion
MTIEGNDKPLTADTVPTLGAPGGRIHLVSVASPGEVGINRLAPTSDLQMEGFTRLGRIDLSKGVLVTVGSEGNGNAGEIAVRSGQLTLSGGSQVDASTRGAGQGGTVTLHATEAITLAGVGAMVDASTSTDNIGTVEGQTAIRAEALVGSQGKAGKIHVQAGTLTLSGGAIITTSTAGAGQGGNVTVQATRALTLKEDGTEIRARAMQDSQGAAGDIDVQVGTLTLTGGTVNGIAISASSSGTGHGGNVTVKATEALRFEGYSRVTSNAHSDGDGGQVVVSAPVMSLMGNGAGFRSQTDGSGAAGNVLVDVGTLTLGGGANIGTSTTISTATGRAGSVTVRAAKEITLAGQQTEIGSTTRGSSDAGQVFVSAPVLRLMEGARIRTGAMQVIGGNASQGNAGDIRVKVVGTLTLTGGASILSSTEGAGRAGDITLNVGSLVAQGATLTSSSTGTATGNAGTILIQGPGGIGTFATRVMLTESGITTDARVADGGNIQVHAQGLVRLRDSKITTTVRGGEGQGGNILIDPDFVILEQSQIRADAFRGPGGKVKIIAQGFVTDAISPVSASSEKNVNGIVDIQAVTTPSGLVAPVPLVFAPAVTLLRSPCAARLHEGTVSTLVERGHAGIPATPDGVLPSRLPLDPLSTAAPAQAAWLPSADPGWLPAGSQRGLSGLLPFRGWAASTDAIRLLPGDCASR